MSSQGTGIPSLLLIFAPMIYCYNMPGFESAVIICIYTMLIIFIKSTFFNHLSAGDEIWSTAPIMYAYVLNNWSPRGLLQCYLITLWGIRLSYNLWRKGGFRGLEDYRWLVVKQRFTNPIAWHCFRVLFICMYQMVINMQLALPVWYVRNGELVTIDFAIFAIGIFFIGYQMVADQQQWDFQCRKKAGGKLENEIGFVSTGLWKFSRHPNYFAELGLWWSVYALTYGLNWGVLGALTMTGLFQRVIRLTEKGTSSKYQDYKKYQANTSKIIPWPPSN